jgi:cellulose synthase/poly-beta-1,6-N-acetylglucosamine synthase-like glycosyltransferase
MEALTSQSYRPLEIIAVDDGSTDGSKDVLEGWAGIHNEIEVTILTQSALGLSAGRNLALECSKGQWVAITDIDCRPDPYWIEELVRVSDGIGDEHVLAVTGRTIFDQGDTKISKIRSRSIATKYASRPRIASLANGPCSMFNRVSLLEVGGFDPSWYHAEDMEVSLRLIASGGIILYTPSAVVHHVAESSLSLFLKKRRRDARAHIRIARTYGQHGVKKPDGSLHRHDFTSDARNIVSLLPIMVIGVTMAISFVLLLPKNSPIWYIASFSVIAWLILTIGQWRRLLWSIALWVGALEGIIDAVLGRHGHNSLFSGKK